MPETRIEEASTETTLIAMKLMLDVAQDKVKPAWTACPDGIEPWIEFAGHAAEHYLPDDWYVCDLTPLDMEDECGPCCGGNYSHEWAAGFPIFEKNMRVTLVAYLGPELTGGKYLAIYSLVTL